MSLQVLKIPNRKKVRILMLKIFDVTKAVFPRRYNGYSERAYCSRVSLTGGQAT